MHIYARMCIKPSSLITKSKSNFLQQVLDTQSDKHTSLRILTWKKVFQVTGVWFGFPLLCRGCA